MPNDNPVPQNQPLQAFPTPNVGDVLIYVIVDSKSGPFNKVSEYGSAYPNKAQYPNHKLVFISPIDEDGNRKYYYACDRQNQDAYNFEISHPYGGRKDAPRYTRTYFLKREDYAPLADGVADPVFSSAILIGQEMKRVGIQELDSLYILVQRVYDIIPAATAFDGTTDATLATYGVRVEYPYNDEAYPRLTWSLPVKHAQYSPTADLSACPVAGFTTLVLVDQEYTQNKDAAVLGTWTRVYEILPSRVNFTPATSPDWGKVYLFTFSAAESYSLPVIGATYVYSATNYLVLDAKAVPDRGSVVKVQLTCSASSSGTQKVGSDIDQIFCISKIVEKKVPTSTNMSLYARGSTYVIGGTTYYVRDAALKDDDGVNATLSLKLTSSNFQSVTEYKLDLETGIIFPEVTQYTLGPSQPTGLSVDANGSYRETKRLECNFWASTTSKTTTLTSDSYDVVVPGKWPAVLQSWSIANLRDNSDNVIRYLVNYELKKAYIGNCRGRVTRSWSRTAPSAAATKTLIPEEIYFDGIFLTVRIPACLHLKIVIAESTGSNHPTYAYTEFSKTFPATNSTTWPSSIVQECNIDRYKGGFMKETLTIYAPS